VEGTPPRGASVHVSTREEENSTSRLVRNLATSTWTGLLSDHAPVTERTTTPLGQAAPKYRYCGVKAPEQPISKYGEPQPELRESRHAGGGANRWGVCGSFHSDGATKASMRPITHREESRCGQLMITIWRLPSRSFQERTESTSQLPQETIESMNVPPIYKNRLAELRRTWIDSRCCRFSWTRPQVYKHRRERVAFSSIL